MNEMTFFFFSPMPSLFQIILVTGSVNDPRCTYALFPFIPDFFYFARFVLKQNFTKVFCLVLVPFRGPELGW